MKKTLRIAAIVLAVVIVILIAAPFLIPVNQFRPTIEQKASEALGRKVQFGNLSLSLLRGSLGAENLSIADDPKFSSSPFLTAKSVNVGVELIPLVFSRTLNVTGITIDQPQVTLLKDSSGRWNYSSLGASAENAPAKPAAAPPSGGAPAAPAALSIGKLELNDGSIILGTTSSKKRSTYDKVNVDASNVSLTSKFPVTVSATLPGGGDFKLDGNMGPLDSADTSLTPVDAKLKINGLDLAKSGFLDPSLGLGGIADLDATLASKGGVASTSGTASLAKALLIAGGTPASIPANVDFNTKYDLRKNSGVLNPSTLKIGKAAAKLSGTYRSAGDDTIVDLKLEGDNMPATDLQSFLPAIAINLPKGASLQTGTLSTNLNITGPTDKLVTNGTVGLFNAKLAGFNLGSKMAAISALTGLKTGNDLQIEKLTSNLHMAPDGLKADNFLAVIPSLGNLAGQGVIDAKNNLDFKMAATLASAAASSSTSTSAPTASSSPAAGLSGLLSKVTGGGGCGGGTTIPFLIQGTASDPKFLPDVGGLAAGMLKSQLGCLGGTKSTQTSGQQQQPASNPLGALSGLFKKKKP
jgi:AsmA protein